MGRRWGGGGKMEPEGGKGAGETEAAETLCGRSSCARSLEPPRHHTATVPSPASVRMGENFLAKATDKYGNEMGNRKETESKTHCFVTLARFKKLSR